MKQLEQLNFEAHAHIKNIVGQDMINDDNIAVKELVKNSIDADASKVVVKFSNTLNKSSESEIVIHDNGAGMSMQDIKQKWLNMAYSSKKTDTSRSYAGNKGIGRFSADRLGRRLEMYTTQKGSDSIIKVDIDWGEFEDRSSWEERINQIKFNSYELTPEDVKKEIGLDTFSSGTYLKISNPRYSWSEEKLSGLKKDLEKFMIPSQVKGGQKFRLQLEVKGYGSDDELSGRIENQVFDKLPFKTSYIESSICSNGKTIETKLYHRGELLIELIEKNKYEHLKHAHIILFYLNPYHKAFFKRQTGMHSVEYGSVFLYLNGFQVPPYGEQDNDWLGVDRRHGQGHSRNLGLRDIVGRIELQDPAGKTYEVTSDREGIKRNSAFLQLRDISDGYFGHTLKKLEKFVVEGLSWDSAAEGYNQIENRVQSYNSELDSFETNYQQSESEKEKTLVSLLDSIILRDTQKDDIVSLKFGPQALDILERQRNEDIEKLQEKLDRYEVKIEAGGKDFRPANLIKTIKKAKEEISTLKGEVKQLTKEKTTAKKELSVEKERRLFAESHLTEDSQRVQNMQHLIGGWGQTIQESFEAILSDIADGKEIDQKELIAEIRKSYFAIQKINKLSQIITKANFDMMTDEINQDVFSYIEEYISEIGELGAGWDIRVEYENPANVELSLFMSPLEVSMLVDNAISNAAKATEKQESRMLRVVVSESDDTYLLQFIDNGTGLNKKYGVEDYFNPGISTTDGSGIGLHHMKQISEKLDAKISLVNHSPSGAALTLEWKK